MTTLTTFLLARIAEDEAGEVYYTTLMRGTDHERTRIDRDTPSPRWLAEAKAKREIVESHTWEASDEGNGAVASSDCIDCWQHPPCATIRALLTIYKDHPDAPDPHTIL